MAIEFQCPECSSTIRVADNAAGKKGSCPTCKMKLIVPVIDAPEEAVAEVPRSKSKSSGQPKSAPEKKVTKPTAPEPEFDLGLQAAAPAKADGKKKEENFANVLNLDVGLDAAPSSSKKAKSAVPKAPVPKSTDTQATVSTAAPPAPLAAPVPAILADEEAGTTDDVPAFLQDTGEAAIPVPEYAPDAALKSQSTAARMQRKKQQAAGSKGGLIFGLVCGIGLIGGVIWYAMKTDIKMGGPRIAYAIERGSSLENITLDPAAFDIEEEASANVLKALKKHSAKASLDSMQLEFGASKAGFEISLKESGSTQFFRFPLDKELKEFRDKHSKEFDSRRKEELKKAVKAFFNKCDVAIRNRESTLPLAKTDPREIGVNACLSGLGYHVAALVPSERGVIPYSCVYEDEANLYFLLPRNTKQFQIAGRYWDGTKSEFPGNYQVTVKAPKAPTKASDTEGSEMAEPAPKSDKPEAMSSEGEPTEAMPEKPTGK